MIELRQGGDGTPQIHVINEDELELEQQIAQRKPAKERSLASLSEFEKAISGSSLFDDESTLSQSTLLFSRSSERDKLKLEEF